MTNRKTPTASTYQFSATPALTPRTCFSAASNTTGIKISNGHAFEAQSAFGVGHFVINTSAPATMTDGICVSTIVCAQNATPNYVTYKIEPETFVPAGYGLYFISTAVTTVGTLVEASWSPA